MAAVATVVDEVLILHHTHTDVGYTHHPPAWWHLSRRFLDGAIDLCEQCADRDERARFKWTCEITGPVRDWLRHRPARQVERFAALCRAGLISIGAAPWHYSPLADAEDWATGLADAVALRQEFQTPIRTCIQHDVNGIAASTNQLLRDMGVDLVIMAINRYFGTVPFPRPALVNWRLHEKSPAIRALSGDIYHSFSRIVQPERGDFAKGAQNLAAYIATLQQRGYPHRFLYLTATHLKFSDNNPPVKVLSDFVQQWNREGRTPVLRIVTSDELAVRMATLAPAEVATHTGDWSEAWGYGLGAAPRHAQMTTTGRNALRTAELIDATTNAKTPTLAEVAAQARHAVALYQEHTFGHAATVYEPDSLRVELGRITKENYACEALALGTLALRDVLESVANNPAMAVGVEGVLAVNASPLASTHVLHVPDAVFDNTWHHHLSSVQQLDTRFGGKAIGVFSLPPWSMHFIPRSEWQAEPAPAAACRVVPGCIASPSYELTFDQQTGRVTSLRDLRLQRELLDASGGWDALSLIHEAPDADQYKPSKYRGRDAIFNPDFALVCADQSGWKNDWRASRAQPQATTHVVRHDADGVSLVRSFAPSCGMRELSIEIKLHAFHPQVEVNVRFLKDSCYTAEAIYLVLPLALQGWRAWWGGDGVPVEMDAGQLPTATRDFTNCGPWLAVSDAQSCIMLATPDTPLAQIGDFQFGRGRLAIDRSGRCLLLPWLYNNYWDTNFNATQAGAQAFRFVLTSAAQFDPLSAAQFAASAERPVIHPVVEAPPTTETPLLRVNGAQLLSLRRAGTALQARLLNPTDHPVEAELELHDPKHQVRTTIAPNSIATLLLPD